MKGKLFLFLLGCAALACAQAQERKNFFDDPFVQVTSAIATCPVPPGPGVTKEELPARAHIRSQHGTSCHLSGRCRLANSYLYDKEIIPRVVQYVRLEGERRLVTLMGCVRSKEQAAALEKAVALVDDVMGVINQLAVVPGVK
jgi:hypothetical protein